MPVKSVTKKRPQTRTKEGAFRRAQWRTVVWNDPVNTMAYVTEVFRRHFGYGQQRASALMLQVHHEGRATVATGLKERMEADVMAMHSYGLKATLEPVEAT